VKVSVLGLRLALLRGCSVLVIVFVRSSCCAIHYV